MLFPLTSVHAHTNMRLWKSRDKQGKDAITNNQTIGISDKIHRSRYKNYIDLIPIGF